MAAVAYFRQANVSDYEVFVPYDGQGNSEDLKGSLDVHRTTTI